MSQWVWYGHAGHLCVANSCRFHLCTKVGRYLVSTVGDYFMDNKRETLGAEADSFFETYVFNAYPGTQCLDTNCLCGMPKVDFNQIEGVRCATAGDAARTHMKMCKKYAGKKAERRGR